MAFSPEQVVASVLKRVAADGQQPESAATARQIASAEAALGFPLPPLLVRVLNEIGNGGFGPDGSLLGIGGGTTDDLGQTAERAYQSNRRVRLWGDWIWPEGWLPICYHGCGVYSCVCCCLEGFPIVEVDPNGFAAAGSQAPRQNWMGPLADWLLSWADGTWPAEPRQPPHRAVS
jgi:hypothetical protein